MPVELLCWPRLFNRFCRKVCRLVELVVLVVELLAVPPSELTRFWKSDCRLLRSVLCVELLPVELLLVELPLVELPLVELLPVELSLVELPLPSSLMTSLMAVVRSVGDDPVLLVPVVLPDWSWSAANRSCMNLCRAC